MILSEDSQLLVYSKSLHTCSIIIVCMAVVGHNLALMSIVGIFKEGEGGLCLLC